MITKSNLYMGGTKFNMKMGDNPFFGGVDFPYASRSEVATYFESMSEPTLSVSNYVATLTFTPIPETIARGMLKSKMVQLRIVRDRAHTTTTKKRGRWSKTHRTKNRVKETFPFSRYTFTYDNDKCNHGPYKADVSILGDRASWKAPTLQELTSGSISINIIHLGNLQYSNGNMCHMSVDFAATVKGTSVYSQFYIGFIYFDGGSVPSKYKMCQYLYPVYAPS